MFTVRQNQSVNDELDQLIRRADLDELVRHVDSTCSARDWDHLLRIRNDARQAVNTGRQLWPIATLANFRLALWAPAELAVCALDDTARTFMPGPVSEIIAQYHPWDELDDHLASGHDRSLIAYERALRDDDIEPGELGVLDIPFERQAWEPHYVVPTYSDDGLDAPAPTLPDPLDDIDAIPTTPIDDPDTVTAFRRVVESWTAQSNGDATIAVVEGELRHALGALGIEQTMVSPLTPAQALAWLTWAGASGGAHGKRRGTATGRSDAWWFLAVFAGIADEWPTNSDEFGEIVNDLSFYSFTDEAAPIGGWNLSLAIVDAEEGLSVAMRAIDVVTDN